MTEQTQNAIFPTRKQDYPEWYQQVIKAGELAENAPVRGCMVIKPWGYALWENIKQYLDARIKATGHENAYFPLFIPISFFEKEAAHIEGFAKECAVVTHYRLEAKDGRLIPAGELEEPLIVRPTSEAIIGSSFSKWIQSHRDLPLLINQWANVVRWEMRPRLFLRTSEFLWQEGHTAHATEQEAKEETMLMLHEYARLVEEVLAMPVILGTKTASEKFPGAEETYTLEGMMQDGKALQMGTSHYLGQTFSKAFNIAFTNRDGNQEHAYTTSWGVTTRLIGGMIMMHSDDDGLRIPPRIAPKHIVLIPFITKAENAERILAYAEMIATELKKLSYGNAPLQVHIDKRNIRGGDKNWNWIKKGVPLRLEIGMRDLESNAVTLARRDQSPKLKKVISIEQLLQEVVSTLDAIQEIYFAAAKQFQKDHIITDAVDYVHMSALFSKDKTGFVHAKWCGNAACEEKVHALKVSIRCLPLEQSKSNGHCVVCGGAAQCDAIYAKSY